jgi:flagellin
MLTALGSAFSTASAALRTAEAARARLDATNEKISTGREVNSAKDNAAAFVTANALRSEAVTWVWREAAAQRLASYAPQIEALQIEANEAMIALREVLLRASDTAVGSTERAALQQEFTAALDRAMRPQTLTPQQIAGALVSGSPDWGFVPWGSDSFLANERLTQTNGVNNFSLTTVAYIPAVGTLRSTFATATQADFTTAVSEINNSAAGGVRRLISVTGLIGQDRRNLERAANTAGAREDLTNALIGQLVDADMGQLAAERDAATVRADVATQGIRTAIAIYGRAQAAVLDSALSNWSRVRAVA